MPPGIEWSNIDDSRVDSLRHIFCLCEKSGHTHIKVGSFDFPASTGSFAVSGLGFQPELVGIMGVDLPTEASDFTSRFHMGFAADGSGEWGGSLAGQFNSYSWNAHRHTYWRSDRIVATVAPQSDTMVASLSSYDADGFTLNVTSAPPGTRRMYYLAARGGDYAVGTTLAPASTGAQAITGLPFRPGGIFAAWASPGTLDTINPDLYHGMGGADETEQYSVWAGTRSGTPQMSMRNDSGKLITFCTAASGGGGAGRSVDAQAALQSLNADGFTLDWTTAAAGTRYFSWLAIGGKIEVERFAFQTGSGIETYTDLYGPTIGVIGFGTDSPDEGWDGSRNGAGTGLSYCGQDVSVEWSCAWGEFFPEILSITNNRRDAASGSCGAFRASGGDANDMRNRINITDLIGTRRTQFIRRPYG